MELLRQTIRTLFFLQKPETVIRGLADEGKHYDADLRNGCFVRAYMDDIGDIRTKDQIAEVGHLAESKWMMPDKDLHYMSFAEKSVFNVLLHFATAVLTEYKDEPVCKYEHILRWNDLTLDLGEDLFTTAYFASKDVAQGTSRTFFSWQDIISNDNSMLNSLFEKPMIDLHYHLYGSSFIFDLNWFSLMTDMAGRKQSFRKVSDYLYSVHYLSEKEKTISLYGQVITAAAIRLYLYNLLVLGNEDSNVAVVLKRLLRVNDEMDYDTLGLELCDLLSDYRLMKTYMPEYSEGGSVYEVLSSERRLMYKVFRTVYSNNIKPDVSTLFYIYLLIKSEFRKEIVQINENVGFSNFQDYQNRKTLFIKKGSYLANIFAQVAIGSSLKNANRFLETRITPNDSKEKIYADVYAIDNGVQKLCDKDGITSRFSYILHFIKKLDKRDDNPLLCRHYKLRKEIKRKALAIKEYIYGCINTQKQVRVVGVDAASSEIACRPEVFGQAFRYLKYNKSSHLYSPTIKELGFTYHVGEDFLSIVDGLRAVDEALLFLHFGNRDRIGHGLVLGTDVEKYYLKRSHYVSLPKQVLLDNIVWLYFRGYKCDGFNKIEILLKALYEKYFTEVYMINHNMDTTIPTIYDYYQSWLLRGDNPELYRDTEQVTDYFAVSHWDMYSLNDLPDVKAARNNQEARNLYRRYHYDYDVYRNGQQSEEIKVDDNFVHIIKQVQEYMLCEIEKRHIAIEANPTSNYRIGDFNHYDEHPIFRFFNYGLNHDAMPSHSISVSINTDDKGVFSTSLEREYSVMSAALEKKNNVSQGLNTPRAIYDWLDRIREMGMEVRFDK